MFYNIIRWYNQRTEKAEKESTEGQDTAAAAEKGNSTTTRQETS